MRGIDGSQGRGRCHPVRVSHFLYVHITWGTRAARPLIDAGRAALLDRFLRTVCRRERCRVVAIGLTATHVHLLLRLHPTTFLPSLLRHLKTGSERSVNRAAQRAHDATLQWAPGCLVHSVSSGVVEGVSEYVRGQATHHMVPLQATRCTLHATH
jgi:REP-associated tyrosine transposase